MRVLCVQQVEKSDAEKSSLIPLPKNKQQGCLDAPNEWCVSVSGCHFGDESNFP